MIVTPDLLMAAAGLLSKDFLLETEEDYFLTPKGMETARQKLVAMGDEDRLLLILYFLQKAEEFKNEPDTPH